MDKDSYKVTPFKQTFKDLSVKDLKTNIIELHNSIYLLDCFSTKDMIIYELFCRELERRGYEVEAARTVTFKKKEKN